MSIKVPNSSSVVPQSPVAPARTPPPANSAVAPSPAQDSFSARQSGAAPVALTETAAPERSSAAAPEKRVIDVYFHVVNQGKGVQNGDIPQSMIDAQIDVLNEAYAGAGFEFRLKDVSRTTNKDWYTADLGSDAEAEMKAALRQGGPDDLNFYTSKPPENTLGWATFPEDYGSEPELDGVVILHESLPGGANTAANLGHTATHEVGHWMGLHHTFNQDGLPDNDGISDTPEHEMNFGRPPEGTDTVPDKPGLDPIHNYMNYVDDAWMSEFTPGQIERMQEQFEEFRSDSEDGAQRAA